MTVDTQLLREIADRVIEARDAKTVIDSNATAIAISQKFTESEMNVAEIRDALEQAAVAQGAIIMSDRMHK